MIAIGPGIFKYIQGHQFTAAIGMAGIIQDHHGIFGIGAIDADHLHRMIRAVHGHERIIRFPFPDFAAIHAYDHLAAIVQVCVALGGGWQ